MEMGLSKFKKLINFIWSRTRDLPACSIVPSPLHYRMPLNTASNRSDIVACVFCRENVFTEPLHSNCRLFRLHCSSFKALGERGTGHTDSNVIS
jgi:hypothetical protein